MDRGQGIPEEAERVTGPKSICAANRLQKFLLVDLATSVRRLTSYPQDHRRQPLSAGSGIHDATDALQSVRGFPAEHLVPRKESGATGHPVPFPWEQPDSADC